MNESPCSSCGAALDGALSGLCAGCLLGDGVQASAEPAAPPLTAGSAIGPYEIVSSLGRGGMGEVYLAWDPRLRRTVAIKVLPPPFAADADRIRRLEREARIIAALNHPRICAVHDVGSERGLRYIVMEHVEGETLADRIARGPLPVDETVRIGIEIAEGLERAHRQGVTHRDLKPANIMLTRSGAKLLDFGLASRAGGADPSTSCLSVDQLSIVGGTVPYMAPEQLAGRTGDERTDVFAFGLVLHEMLTGSRPADEPRLPPPSELPPTLARTIRRCLHADPDDRWQSIRDVRFALTAAVEEAAVAVPAAAAAPLRRRLPWPTLSAIAAVLAASIAGALVAPVVADHHLPSHAIRFTATMPRPDGDVAGAGGMARISPDGLSLAWTSAGGDGKTMLAVQPLDATAPTVLAGTDDARWPFWSPDSRTIGFFAQGELRTVPAAGGPVETIAKAPYGEGGSWSGHAILFVPDRTGAVYRVSDRGGAATRVTTLDASRGETSHQWPEFLADGRHFSYFAWSNRATARGLWVGDLDSGNRIWLGASDGGAAFASPGHLLFTRAGMLVAQRFDPKALRLVDQPRVLAEHVCGASAIQPPCFSASTNGVLVYHAVRLFRHQLAWFTRAGRQTAVPMEPGSYFGPALSADGARVLLNRHDPRTWQLGVWQFDLARGMLSRVFDEAMAANDAVWAGDGRALAFTSNTADRHEIYTVDGTGGSPRLRFRTSKPILLTDWSSDGGHLLFQTRGDATRDDVWTLSLADGEARPFAQSRSNERHARFSPDGRWVAYTSDASGRPEIYVQTWPPTGNKWQISTDGGQQPAWRRDGRELFYLTGDRRLMAARLHLTAEVTVSAVSELFRVPADAPVEARMSYAPAADGQRFLVNVAAPDRVRLPMFETQVVVNWTATLSDAR